MKKIHLFLLLPIFSFARIEEKTIRLSGYFIVQCFNPIYKCPCGLNIASADLISSDSLKNAKCLCDGNYCMNFGLIYFVSSNDLDLNKIDDFDYQVKLQAKEHLVFLSTNKNILRDAFTKDSTLAKDSALVHQIESDSTTAEAIQKLIAGIKLDYTKKVAYRVLLKGDVTVVQLKDRPSSKEYKNPMAYAQYVFLNDQKNHLEFVKVIKDSF